MNAKEKGTPKSAHLSIPNLTVPDPAGPYLTMPDRSTPHPNTPLYNGVPS